MTDDLISDLVALVRAGCEIRFLPRRGSTGILSARVMVIPPTPPRSAKEEFGAVVHGSKPSAPVFLKFNLYGDAGALAKQLHRVRQLFIPPR